MPESYSVKAILSAVDKGFTSTLNNCTRTIDKIDSKLNGLSFGVFAGIGQSAFNAITNSVSDLIGELDDASKAWKTFEGNMEMLGKSADEIEAVKKELQDFATQTIYSASDMASTYAQLAAVGVENTTELVKGFGGLAAAAENPQQAMKTLSQQATQLAAKPKVAWADFKLMLEQSPAGMAAVADAMGMSLKQLVAQIQDTKGAGVDTLKFFDAIAKTAGTGSAFEIMATQYKTVGQAMDGLSETISNKMMPAYNALSDIGINAVSSITDKVSELDGESIAAAFSVERLKDIASGLGTVLGGSIAAIGGINTFQTLSAGAEKYGMTLSGITDMVDNLSGKASTKLGNITSRLKGLSLKSVSKNAKKGVKELNSIFQNAGKALNNYGEDVALAFEAISTKFSDVGLAVGTKFAGLGDIISSTGGKMTKKLRKSINSATKVLGGFSSKVSSKVSTIAKPFSFMFSGIGKGIKASTKVGMSAMNGMTSALTKVMFLAMKSVGPAAILGLAIAGLGVLDGAFGDQINSLIQTATTKGPEIISNLADSIIGKLPSLMNAGAQILNGLMGAVTANLPTIFSVGIQIIQSLVQGVSDNLPVLIPSAILLVSTFASGILNAIPDILMTGLQFVLKLVQGIDDNADLLTDSASNTINGFVDGIVSKLPEIIQTGVKILSTLVKGAIKMLPKLITTAFTAVSSFINGISSNLPQVMQGGVEIVHTLIAGIIENFPTIIQSAVQAIGTFATAVLGNLPTIVSAGGQIIVSAVTGIIQMLPDIADAGWTLITTLGNAIIEAVPKVITGAVEGIKTVFGGLWDFVTGKSSEGVTETVSEIASMASGIETSFASMNDLGATGMNGFATGVINSASAANTMASGEIESLASNMDSIMSDIAINAENNLSDLPNITESSMNGIVNEMEAGGNEAVAVADDMIASVVDTLSSGQSDAYSAGAYVSQGFAQGMLSCLGEIQSAAAQMVSAADSAIVAKAKIHSPSDLTWDEGEYFGEGWVGGILAKVKDARKAAEKLISMPTVRSPRLAGNFGMELSEDYEYYRNAQYTIVVPVELDGRETARVIAPYTEEELNKRQTRDSRKRGKV